MENWRKHLIREFAGFEVPSDNTSRELLKRTIKRNAKNIASKSLKYRLLRNPITAFLTTLMYPSELGDATLPDEYVKKVADEYKKEKNKLDKKKKESDCDKTYPVQVDLSNYNLDPRIERKVRILLTDPKLCDVGIRIHKPDYFKDPGEYISVHYVDLKKEAPGYEHRHSGTPPGGTAGIRLPSVESTAKNGRCLESSIITSSNASQGWGPLLYELLLEIASARSTGITPDRASVSLYARKVWAKYESRPDTEKIQLDVDTYLTGKSSKGDNITPDIPEDDCKMDALYDYPGGPMKKLVNNPLSMVYRKDNRNLFKVLRKNNRIIVDGF